MGGPRGYRLVESVRGRRSLHGQNIICPVVCWSGRARDPASREGLEI